MNVGKKRRGLLSAQAIVVLAAITFPFLALAQTNYKVGEYASQKVTDFLHSHGLPLVGAQVLDNNDGSRELHLYGFVATPNGMQDAEQKAMNFLGDPTMKVVNSIEVNPAIQQLRPLPAGNQIPAAAETPVAPPQNSGSQWDRAIDNIYKNGAQPLPQPSGPPLP